MKLLESVDITVVQDLETDEYHVHDHALNLVGPPSHSEDSAILNYIAYLQGKILGYQDIHKLPTQEDLQAL